MCHPRFLDFSTFYTADHEYSFLKLEKCDIQGTHLRWFKNYLSNR